MTISLLSKIKLNKEERDFIEKIEKLIDNYLDKNYCGEASFIVPIGGILYWDLKNKKLTPKQKREFLKKYKKSGWSKVEFTTNRMWNKIMILQK